MEITVSGVGTDKQEALWDAKNKVMNEHGPDLNLALTRQTWLYTDADGIQHWVFHFELIGHE